MNTIYAPKKRNHYSPYMYTMNTSKSKNEIPKILHDNLTNILELHNYLNPYSPWAKQNHYQIDNGQCVTLFSEV